MKYVLPALWPLCFAGIFAALLWPLTRFFVRRLRLPRTLAAGISLAAGLGLLAGIIRLFCLLCCLLAPAVAGKLPACMELARSRLGELCLSVERGLSLRPGVLYVPLGEAAEQALQTMTTECMRALTRQGTALWQLLPELGISLGVLLIAVILWQTDGGQLREKVANTPPGRRILTAGAHMRTTFLCQLRCELLGIAATAVICAGAFALTGSARPALFGAVIALLDILPLLGAAIALAPLAILALLRRRYLHALIYLAALLLIWLIRQWIDAKLMGRRLGLTSLETIIAMWCGWKLLGFWGFVLGPGLVVFIAEILKLPPES